MIKVMLESPYAGDVEKNIKYAQRAMRHSIMLGEAPMVSHLLYTQCLDDTVANERSLGIAIGLDWLEATDKTVVYADLGISTGMQHGIDRANAKGHSVEMRYLDK